MKLSFVLLGAVFSEVCEECDGTLTEILNMTHEIISGL